MTTALRLMLAMLINAILLDRKHGTLWGASSNNGQHHGIAW